MKRKSSTVMRISQCGKFQEKVETSEPWGAKKNKHEEVSGTMKSKPAEPALRPFEPSKLKVGYFQLSEF